MAASASARPPSHWDWVREQVELLEVAQTYGLQGLKREGRAWRALCPFHDDHHPSLTLHPGTRADGGLAGTWRCWVCDDRHGSAIDLVAALQGCSAADAMERLYAEWGGPDAAPHARIAPVSAPPPVPEPPAAAPDDAPAALVAWYAALWDQLPLAEPHRAALRARGLSEAALTAWRFRTLPPEADALRRDWRVRVEAAAGPWPDAGLPGLTTEGGGQLVGAAGLLIPVFDRTGRIAGAQIRPDHPGGGGKYRWWSSRDRPGGAAAVSRATWIWPRGTDPDWPHAPAVIVTEGVLKAIVIAEALAVPVVGVAGFQQWSRILPGLDAWPIPVIATAFDADVWADPGKAPAEVQCWHTLTTRYPARTIHALRWDGSRAKGFDDALAAGLAWTADAPPVSAPRGPSRKDG